jgi:hypothetical protein
VTRRHLIHWAALQGVALRVSAAAPSSLLLLSAGEAARLKPPPRLKSASDVVMRKGPWSVVYHRPGALSEAGPHDFFSEGPYWWPDPARPGGPYIRRDGVVNPDRFTANDQDMDAMSNAVLTLGLAAYFLKDAEAAARAWHLLDVWFLQPDTLMNPNLEFGQAIRGVTTGRGIGVIDTRPLIWCAQGAALLESSFPRPELQKGVKKWFLDYVSWLKTSKKGIDERDNGNNHSTWWAAQVAAYAVYCGDRDAEQAAYDFYRTIVPKQLQPDGSAPAEELRTKSLSYSFMNLDGFSLLCRIARRRGTDLWGYRSPGGSSVLKSVEYLAPFVQDPSKWLKQQIGSVGARRGYFLGLAGLDNAKPEWVNAQRATAAPGGAWGILYEMLLAS